jgi:hypothetical protein
MHPAHSFKPRRALPIWLGALLALMLAQGALAQAGPPQTTAVWDKDVARQALKDRAHRYLTSLAKSRTLMLECSLPESVLATQRTLEGAYRSALLDLNLATVLEIRQWQTPDAGDPALLIKVSPEQCTLFAKRLAAAAPVYQNALQDIAELRKVL